MKEKFKKINPSPKEFSFFEKAGICVVVHSNRIVMKIMREFLEANLLGRKEKLPKEKRTKILQEIAIYICFETLIQVQQYEKGLSKDAIHKISYIMLYYFARIFHIENLPEKLKEYNGIKNTSEYVSRKILKILNIVDFFIFFDTFTRIATMNIILFEGIGRMIRLPEKIMEETVKAFFISVSSFRKQN